MSLTEISAIVTEIRTTLLKAGVVSSQIAFKAKKIETASDDAAIKARNWLIGFRDVYVRRYHEARALAPEGVWDMYDSMGIKGTQEQNILDQNRKLLINAWKERPDILKRTSDAELKRRKKVRKASK